MQNVQFLTKCTIVHPKIHLSTIMYNIFNKMKDFNSEISAHHYDNDDDLDDVDNDHGDWLMMMMMLMKQVSLFYPAAGGTKGEMWSASVNTNQHFWCRTILIIIMMIVHQQKVIFQGKIHRASNMLFYTGKSYVVIFWANLLWWCVWTMQRQPTHIHGETSLSKSNQKHCGFKIISSNT